MCADPTGRVARYLAAENLGHRFGGEPGYRYDKPRRISRCSVRHEHTAPSEHDSTVPWSHGGRVRGRMAHFSAFRAFENGLFERCARHDSNVRPLPPQGSALSPELRARFFKLGAASVTDCSLGCFVPLRLKVGVYWYQPWTIPSPVGMPAHV
jgi:hypothetical protein